MKKQNNSLTNAAILRQKAEEQLKKQQSKRSLSFSEPDMLKLIHELEVHQIELEMQNEELVIAKEKAELAEEKYTELYDFAPSGYLSLLKDGKIKELNFVAAKMLSQERSKLIKRQFTLFVTVNTRSVFSQFLQKVFVSKLKQTCELIISTEGNLPIIVNIDCIVSQDDEFCLLTLTDITERKLAETNLLQAKEHAEESDHLKTAFLQNMSHEIRTPMNAICGFSKMLNKPELSDEKRKSFISIIINSTNQLLSIVTDILTISSVDTKQEKVNIQKVCINSNIVDLLAIFKTQAQNQNISLYAKQQLTDRQSEIFTDNTKITQILSNLITNALKFTHEGFIEFGYNLKGEFIEFYVKDSGIGIKTEMQEKIFERFRQANENINKKYGGTGLGLAISKAFTELLGGKIWVQSELDKGSTFYFTIPYKPVHEIDKTNSPTEQNENFPTVLVAEDEECNFLLIEELLCDMDLKLIHAKDGKETVEICRTNPKIDLVLMDIKMPIMSGHEAAKLIKEFRPDLAIIAQSAYGLEQEIEKYSGIFDDYVTKPIDENELQQKIMKYINNQVNKT
jgi:signal transduction histidine kinase/ActR/RegA family two-component response regulator